MMKRRLSTPALIPGAVVLVLALAGSAIAGPTAMKASVTKRQQRTIAKKVSKKQIKKAAPTLVVAKAATADHAGSADSATAADTAAKATQADNAAKVNGNTVTEINYRATEPSA